MSRLTKIYTRTGDDGTAGLADGTRIDKDHARIEVVGNIDELNSCMGLILAETLPEQIRTMLTNIQHELFDLGAEVSVPDNKIFTTEYVTRLENDLDRLNANLPALKEFILPGGTRAAAAAHLARTICRRTERSMVTLNKLEAVNRISLSYLNRLSDLLFVIARVLVKTEQATERMWRHKGEG